MATRSAKEELAAVALAELQQVQKARRYHQVTQQIQALIANGVLKPGDHLPAERELARKLGVGRSSIRDAIRTLEVMGVLESHQGSGTIVRDASADALVVPLSRALFRKKHLLAELVDVRMMIEPALASRAAQNATPDEIDNLGEILLRQGQKMRQGLDTIEEDSAFHYAIALAAGNSVVHKILDVLMDMLRDSRVRSLQVPGRPQRSYVGHRAILRAVKQRDAAAAARASRKHLREIQEMLMKKL